jgi:hypothetical protein
MNDDASDWMSVDEAATYVEATVGCYREKAIDLLRQAADGLKVKSRTVNSSPRWIVDSDIAGNEIFYSDHGKRIELYRDDVLKLWPKHHRKDATQSTPLKTRSSAISDGIRLAMNNLWPGGIPEGVRAKERDNQIREWLKDNRKSIPENVPRAVQRVLKKLR